jgi:hypothetical protein
MQWEVIHVYSLSQEQTVHRRHAWFTGAERLKSVNLLGTKQRTRGIEPRPAPRAGLEWTG